jgi:hypothetical protein
MPGTAGLIGIIKPKFNIQYLPSAGLTMSVKTLVTPPQLAVIVVTVCTATGVV